MKTPNCRMAQRSTAEASQNPPHPGRTLLACLRISSQFCVRLDLLDTRRGFGGCGGSMVHCRAFSGAAEGLRQRDCSAFRGDRLCRQHAGACARGERAGALLVSALTANVKLPITHVEASQKALEQLRQSSNVNRAPPGKPRWMLSGKQARRRRFGQLGWLFCEIRVRISSTWRWGLVMVPCGGRLLQRRTGVVETALPVYLCPCRQRAAVPSICARILTASAPAAQGMLWRQRAAS